MVLSHSLHAQQEEAQEDLEVKEELTHSDVVIPTIEEEGFSNLDEVNVHPQVIDVSRNSNRFSRFAALFLLNVKECHN